MNNEIKNIEFLEKILLNALESQREDEFFDFKLKWHENIEDLIKDIICFTNTVHDKDSYIFFGISDEFKVIGIKPEERRKQAEIVDTMSKLYFSCAERPIFSVKTINIEDKIVDVLVIKNINNTPLFLDKPYGKMKSGCIYSRELDRNTPNNGNSTFSQIERLWKKRFGFNKTKKEIFFDLLVNKMDWSYIEPEYYNSYFPEFRIKIEDGYENFSNADAFYSYAVINESTSFSDIKLQYKGEVIDLYQGVTLDSGRLFIPTPEWGFISNRTQYYKDNIVYRYYLKDSFRYRLLQFLYDRSNEEANYAFNRFKEVILFFENSEEREIFESYILANLNELENLKNNSKDFDYMSDDDLKMKDYKEKLKYGLNLNILLNKFRKTS
ncbi:MULTISPECIES: ATP-binding protein [unclassified Gemella]|uniref:ATP-binding protein n=1 Tax=unclassified Gemella TaxID=2624949 RepID=UPI001C054E51|nr:MULTISPECIES: ATP-binding protein [unclassified Gemella]MBU0279137.1 ATP-binding protein [Gemella sp. zg-1178]QWQ38614.1 ATP-binding protein [Gemella sp. zg-570]